MSRGFGKYLFPAFALFGIAALYPIEGKSTVVWTGDPACNLSGPFPNCSVDLSGNASVGYGDLSNEDRQSVFYDGILEIDIILNDMLYIEVFDAIDLKFSMNALFSTSTFIDDPAEFYFSDQNGDKVSSTFAATYVKSGLSASPGQTLNPLVFHDIHIKLFDLEEFFLFIDPSSASATLSDARLDSFNAEVGEWTADPVPVPATLALLVSGFVSIIAFRACRRRMEC